MKKHLNCYHALTVLISTGLLVMPFDPVQAVDTDIVLDNTLQVNPVLPNTVPDPATGGTIQPINQDNGQAAGANLFYSFSQFNIGSGDTAYFNLTQNWDNVIARVTGGMASLIDGTLRVGGTRVVDGDSGINADYMDGIAGATTIENGASNFFFINPAGIVFGAGSVVDVPGSFYASTSSTLEFPNNVSFGVENGQPTVDALSSANPVAFGFLGNETGALTLDQATIQVFDDETLALVGREVNINNSTVGQVDLTRPQPGFNEVGLPKNPANFDVNNFATYPRFVTKGPLFVDGIQLLVMANQGNRNVQIFNHNPYDFLDGNGDPDEEARTAYNNNIAATLNNLDGTINITNTDLINAGGDAEEITFVRGGNINLTNASIVSSNYGDDCGGICQSDGPGEPVPGISGIDILATGMLNLNNGHIVTETAFTPVNPAPDNVAINIQAASMLMENGSTVSTKSLNAANINPVYIPAGILPVPLGLDPKAGNIAIKVVNRQGVYGDFTARGGSSVESSSETFGDAGAITIDAASITLNNAGIKSESTSATNGLSGYIKEGNGNILRNDSARIGRTTVYTLLSENRDLFTIPWTTPSALLPGEPPTNETLFIIDENKDAGAAGSISLTARTGDIALTNSTVSTNIASGTNLTNAASISLVSGNGSVNMDNSTISSTTSGDADAGNVTLTSGGSITMANNSEITTDTQGVNDNKSGSAGTISTLSNGLSISSGSLISSSTNGLGAAGSVNVSAGTLTIQGLGPIPVSQLGRYIQPDFTGIRTIATANSSGLTGSITINTSGDVIMSDGAQISNSNLATLTNSVDLKAANDHPSDITINASNLTMHNSQIVADSSGNVDASDIAIAVKNWLKMDPSAISTAAYNGNGGDINVLADLLWLQDSEIITSVYGPQGGDGGDITISADVLLMDSGFIQANSTSGDGGAVNIKVDTLLPTNDTLFIGGNTRFDFQPYSGINVIQAVAPNGVNGQINSTSPQLNLSGTLATLIVQSFDPNAISRNLCAIGESSSLAQSGKGGLRRRAKDALITTNPAMSF
jgi:filamentous hemagglutinin family protein